MQLAHVAIYARDVRASVEFYERAFGLRRSHFDDEENGAYAELETGATTLAFVSNELAERHLPEPFRRNDPAEPPPGVQLSLVVDDVEERFRRAIEAGAAPVASPEPKPWGQVTAFVRDLDGVLVELGSEPSE